VGDSVLGTETVGHIFMRLQNLLNAPRAATHVVVIPLLEISLPFVKGLRILAQSDHDIDKVLPAVQDEHGRGKVLWRHVVLQEALVVRKDGNGTCFDGLVDSKLLDIMTLSQEDDTVAT
jgi:hypothetical protein